jgi:hypothetical protein
VSVVPEIRMLGQHRIGGRLLASEIGECVVDKRLLSNRSFEVRITRPSRCCSDGCWVAIRFATLTRKALTSPA